MSAPPCPELAAELFIQLRGANSLEYVYADLFYLLSAMLTGGWIDLGVTSAISTETMTLIRTLPSKDAFLMYCTPKKYTLDEVAAARVAIKLLS